MKSIKTQAIFTGFRSRRDGSIGFSGETPEVSPQEKALFFELQGVNLEITILPKDELNLPEYQIQSELETKTPGRRLRNVLYRTWEHEGMLGDFEYYYKTQMEKFINYVKQKIV